MKEASPLETRPTPPLIWPSPVGQEHPEWTDTLQRVLEHTTAILGVTSAVNRRGVNWLLEFLDRDSEPQILVVLAVFGGCPTRSDDLARLLELQDQAEGDRIQFRILPMSGGSGAPANCLVAVPPAGTPPILVAGPTPNFGIDEVDRTQVNLCFEAESTLFDQWRSWFDEIWLQSAPLTKDTVNIPALVPATGTPAATAQWQTYCDTCAQSVKGHDSPLPVRDPETGDVSSGEGGDRSEDPPPTEIAKLPKLDPLQDRVVRLFRAGQQVTISYSSAARPLVVPIKPSLLRQAAKIQDGSVVQRQSFSISAFSDSELKTIKSYRQSSRTIIEKLAFPLATGVYWLPKKAAKIFEQEWQAKNREAKDMLKQVIGGSVDNFVDRKVSSIKDDLNNVFWRLGGTGEVPGSALREVVADLERRIGLAIEGQFVAPVTFSEVQFLPQPRLDGQAPWAQAEKLVLGLARFPRKVMAHPKRSLSGLTTPEREILTAMDVEHDAILRGVKTRLGSERRARSEQILLDRIIDADLSSRDRCEAVFMLIDGKSPSEIHGFIAKNESGE